MPDGTHPNTSRGLGAQCLHFIISNISKEKSNPVRYIEFTSQLFFMIGTSNFKKKTENSCINYLYSLNQKQYYIDLFHNFSK